MKIIRKIIKCKNVVENLFSIYFLNKVLLGGIGLMIYYIKNKKEWLTTVECFVKLNFQNHALDIVFVI